MMMTDTIRGREDRAANELVGKTVHSLSIYDYSNFFVTDQMAEQLRAGLGRLGLSSLGRDASYYSVR